MTTALFAQSDFWSLPAIFYFAVRVGVAIVAGLVGWFLAAPIMGLFYRLAFQKPLPRAGESISRFVGTLGLALLAYFLIPFGPGWGPGLGGGPGPGGGGPGPGGQGTTGPKDGKNTGSDGSGTPKNNGTAVLAVEIVTKKNYKGDDRFYLIGNQAMTIDEVEAYLKENKGQYGRMDIIIYANSFSHSDTSVDRLEKLAKKYSLTPAIPPKYGELEKAVTPAGG